MDPPDDEFSHAPSAEEFALRRRAGEAFWVEERPIPDDVRRENAEELQEWLDGLPGHVEAIRELYSSHDAFDVFAGLLTLQADQHNRPPTARSPFLDAVVPGEIAALVLLRRPRRDPTETTEASLPESIIASIPHLEALTDFTGATLSGVGTSEEPDALAAMQDRFVRRYLFVPINETDSQARAWLHDLFDSEVISGWLATHTGFTVPEAERMAAGAFGLVLAAIEATSGPPEPGIGEIFTFSARELAEASEVSERAADAFVAMLSQGFDQPDHAWPVLPTALRQRPMISDGAGRYYLVTPALLIRGLRHALAAQLNPAIATGDGDQRVYQLYLARRAGLVEQRALSTLDQVVRADFVGSNLHFRLTREDKLEGEIDGLLVVGDIPIVIQAKSAPTRIDAVAGDRDAFASVLRTLLTESMRQHDDARRALEADRDLVRFWRMENGRRRAVEVPQVDGSKLLPVTVTLEDLSGCAPALWELRDAGLATDGRLPWVVGITPLGVMVELLDFAAQLIHFLRRRVLLNETRNLEVVDEVDVFLEFLHDHLDVVFAPFGANEQRLVLMPPERFHALDDWLQAQREGDRRAARPRQDLPRGLRRLLERLEHDRPPGWLEMSVAALGGSKGSRTALAKAANRFLDGKRRDPEGASYMEPGTGRIGVLFVNVIASEAESTEEITADMLARARRDQIGRLYAVGIPDSRDEELVSIWAGPVPGIRGPSSGATT